MLDSLGWVGGCRPRRSSPVAPPSRSDEVAATVNDVLDPTNNQETTTNKSTPRWGGIREGKERGKRHAKRHKQQTQRAKHTVQERTSECMAKAIGPSANKQTTSHSRMGQAAAVTQVRPGYFAHHIHSLIRRSRRFTTMTDLQEYMRARGSSLNEHNH